MPSLNKIAFAVYDAIKGGHGENNENPPLRLIKYWVLQYRALMIRQALDRGDRPNEFEQEMDRIIFDYLPPEDGGNIGDPVGGNKAVLISRIQEFPAPVRTKDDIAFTYIGTPDGTNNFQLVDFHEADYRRYDKYTGQAIRAMYHRNRIWILNYPQNLLQGLDTTPDAPYVDQTEGYVLDRKVSPILLSVRGIFEDPGAAFLAAGYDYDDDSEYFPASLDIAQRLTQAMMDNEIRTLLNIPEDVILNNLPDNRTSVPVNG